MQAIGYEELKKRYIALVGRELEPQIALMEDPDDIREWIDEYFDDEDIAEELWQHVASKYAQYREIMGIDRREE